MKKYEYNITYYSLGYFPEHDPYIETVPMLPHSPDPTTLVNNAEYLTEMQTMGEEGWELVTVSPALRGCYNDANGYGFSLTSGYFLFWRRIKN